MDTLFAQLDAAILPSGTTDQGSEESTDRALKQFRLVGHGLLGDVEAAAIPESQLSEEKRNELLLHKVCRPENTLPPHGLPPTRGTTEQDAAAVNADLVDEYLRNLDTLSIHTVSKVQRYFKREVDPSELFEIRFPSAPTSKIEVEIDPVSGLPNKFVEAPVGATRNASALTSSSLQRNIGIRDDYTFGTSTNVPFRPGGLLDASTTSTDKGTSDGFSEPFIELDFEHNLSTVATGMPRGVDFSAQYSANDKKKISEDTQKFDMELLIQSNQPPASFIIPGTEMENTISAASAYPPKDLAGQDSEEVDNALNTSTLQPLSKIKATLPSSTSWAVKEESSVDNFHDLVPNMARKWPFELDKFQKQAVLHLERHESVFVAAHTSAGKTVVAEYAIALATKHMTRCVYTSPIKALSNQKFRDFRENGIDVGLLTGDIQLSPEASCLIMTTEILRSMLYRGADVIRDVEWVIFDEVHYVNDAERGVVWEEVIIMLPDHVNIIMLSATVPNTFEFADWVGRTKQKKIYVISTAKRPVPLEHFLYTGNSNKTSNELFKLVDAKGTLLSTGYKKAMAAKTNRQSEKDKTFGAKNRQHGGPGSDKGLYVSLVTMLDKKGLRPCVVFTLSKKRCEQNADSLHSLDLTSTAEKSEIHVFFQASVARLSGSDKRLPQVLRMREMLKRGIGVHHGGLLPLMKEVVELLFGRGLVKVLFATETFAMGVNMPARCVVFDSTRKFDGDSFRDLLTGEYIQMAGRAGRRGLDDTGTVIILVKGDLPELSDLKRMILGIPTRLDSKFRLTYNMILNLLRVEELRVEDMMKRSFAENVLQKDAVEHQSQLEEYTTQLSSIKSSACGICTEENLKQACDMSEQIVHLTHSIQSGILAHASKVLSPGRVVVLNSPMFRNCIAVILRAEQQRPSRSLGATTSSSAKFSVLVVCDPPEIDQGKDNNENENYTRSVGHLPVNKIQLPSGPSHFEISAIAHTDILLISAEKVKFSVLEILDRPDENSRSRLAQQLLRIAESSPNGLNQLDPVKDMKIKNLEFIDNWNRKVTLESTIRELPCNTCPEYTKHYTEYLSKRKLNDLAAKLHFQLSDKSLQLLPEYEQRVDVLKILSYIDDSKAVQLKGRVACEVTTCDELVATELVFENILTPLDPAEIVALLSSLVFQQKVGNEPKLSPVLAKGVEEIKRVATKVAEAQQECGMNMPIDEYLRTLHFGLVEVVYAWARGIPFADITELTDVQEGNIVRCIVRLDETCRDVRNAARVIGDPLLYQKMDEASVLIKRDIVFAASLYIN